MKYKTSDLNLSAFLRAKHSLTIEGLEPDPRNTDQALFVFVVDDATDIQKYVAEYFNGNDLCSINAYSRELTDLRSWLKNYRINKDNR